MVDFHDRRDGRLYEIPGNPENAEKPRTEKEERQHEEYWYRKAQRDYDSDYYYDN